LPRDTARRIIEGNLWGSVKPRLKNIWVGGFQKAVVCIRLDILQPKPVSDGTEQKKRRTSRPKPRPSAPVERPPILDPLYLPSASEEPPSRIYCEKCKKAHLDFECPTCGNDHRNATLGSCDYCNTEFGGSRKNCPVCTVQKTLDKAEQADRDGDLAKAIDSWRKAYDEVCAGRLAFSHRDIIAYAGYLAAASFTEDSMKLLRELRARFGKDLAASPRTSVEYSDYFSKLSHVHEGMASALASDRTPATPTRQAGILFHGMLRHLYYQCHTSYSGIEIDPSNSMNSPTDSYYTNRMKEILRQAGLHKQGRPEQLQEILVKQWQTVPQINTDAVRDEIVKLSSSWS
jgi:hypothetical protein